VQHEIPLGDIPEGQSEHDVGDRFPVLIIRKNDTFAAVRGICPHMGAPLVDGQVCGRSKTVRCPWHGYLFSYETGAFLENPNRKIFAAFAGAYESYDAGTIQKMKIATYACTESNGVLKIASSGEK